jgi:hypothetical protein
MILVRDTVGCVSAGGTGHAAVGTVLFHSFRDRAARVLPPSFFVFPHLGQLADQGAAPSDERAPATRPLVT